MKKREVNINHNMKCTLQTNVYSQKMLIIELVFPFIAQLYVPGFFSGRFRMNCRKKLDADKGNHMMFFCNTLNNFK